MIDWKPLHDPRQLNDIIEKSHEVPCLIFKHSTRCSISSMAKYRLEGDWNLSSEMVEPYFLDLIAFREISNLIARELGVRHESPQLILLKDGICIYDTSHLDISVEGIKKQLGLTTQA